MKGKILWGAVVLLSLTSCGLLVTKDKIMYPLWNGVEIMNEDGDGISWPQWGEKLIYKGKTEVIHGQTCYLVQRELDHKQGYVAVDSVVRAPIARGVILNSVLVYNTPDAVYATQKITATPPVLLYVIEVKNDGYAKIRCYNATKLFQLSENMTKISGEKWVKLSDISTNKDDVDVIVAVQHALYSVRKISPTNTTAIQTALQTQNQFLSSDLPRMYPNSSALIYAQQARDIFSALLGIKNEDDDMSYSNSDYDTEEGFGD